MEAATVVANIDGDLSVHTSKVKNKNLTIHVKQSIQVRNSNVFIR